MDFSKLKEIGCRGVIGNGFYIVYDECSLAIYNKDGEATIFPIDKLHKLIKGIAQAETDMLENYKHMSFEEKAEFCKYHDIKYSTLQQIITLRGE